MNWFFGFDWVIETNAFLFPGNCKSMLHSFSMLQSSWIIFHVPSIFVHCSCCWRWSNIFFPELVFPMVFVGRSTPHHYKLFLFLILFTCAFCFVQTIDIILVLHQHEFFISTINNKILFLIPHSSCFVSFISPLKWTVCWRGYCMLRLFDYIIALAR